MAERVRRGDRNFSQDEAEEILQRAARMSGPGPRGTELSLSDLQQIAQDSGIDPHTLERAISEMESQPSLSERIFLGAPLAIHVERVLDQEVPASAFELLLPEIQRVLGEVGHLSLVGNTLTWTSATQQQGSPTQVTVSRAGGRVTLRASSRLSGAAGGLLGGIGGGVGGGLGGPIGALIGQTTHSVPLTFAAVAGIVGGALLLARTLYGAVVRSKERKLTTLVERLTATLRSAREQGG